MLPPPLLPTLFLLHFPPVPPGLPAICKGASSGVSAEQMRRRRRGSTLRAVRLRPPSIRCFSFRHAITSSSNPHPQNDHDARSNQINARTFISLIEKNQCTPPINEIALWLRSRITLQSTDRWIQRLDCFCGAQASATVSRCVRLAGYTLPVRLTE